MDGTAVFVPKKSGQLRICIDYRELNKHNTKDSYPLPLPDEVQDQLAGLTIFSMLDLHSGCLSILQTETRLLSAQVLVCGFTCSAGCHLDYQVPLVHSSA